MDSNILLIGNGFDLSHNLPTKYTDFLDICEIASKPYTKDPSTYDGNNTKFKEFVAKTTDREDLYLKFRKLICNNFWIQHFMDRRMVISDKWIDFENEIKNTVYKIYREMESSDSDDPRLRLPPTFVTTYASKVFKGRKTFTYKDLFESLLSDHKKLVIALNIYMDCYVNKIEITKKPLISKLNANRILSFNYTSTYTENYNACDVDCCYIHGMANYTEIDNEPHNLVLGFDDHYMDDTSIIPELIPFEKYYQRIINRTDNQYYKWLEDIGSSSKDVILYIFGHSLTPSDGDIIREFVTHSKIATYIYYLNEYDRAEKVKNLAIIIGPESLIKLTGGINPKIIFVPIKE